MSVYYDDDPWEGDGVYDLGDFEMDDFATADEILEDLDDLGIEGEEIDDTGYTDLEAYAEDNSTNYGNHIPEWYDDDDDEWLEG